MHAQALALHTNVCRRMVSLDTLEARAGPGAGCLGEPTQELEAGGKEDEAEIGGREHAGRTGVIRLAQDPHLPFF